MAEKHPYASPGAVIAVISQFRKSFPANVSADTLRKLSIAPNNESYVINTLRFVGAIDTEGNKTAASTAVFNHHEAPAFQKAFGEMVEKSYAELFKLRGDEAWELDSNSLISFFRANDQTSDAVGRKQAATFQALASLAGHGAEPATPKPSTKSKDPRLKGTKSIAAKAPSKIPSEPQLSGNSAQRDVGLTVRIEVNLPAAADQETYDRIFRSIRENLLNAK